MTEFQKNLDAIKRKQDRDGFLSLGQWTEHYREGGRNHLALSIRGTRIAFRHSQHKRVIYKDAVESDKEMVSLLARIVSHF